MKKYLTLLATLGLAVALSPAVFAQQDQSQPDSNPPPTTSPTQDTMGGAQTQSFSGTIVKAGNQFVLKTN